MAHTTRLNNLLDAAGLVEASDQAVDDVHILYQDGSLSSIVQCFVSLRDAYDSRRKIFLGRDGSSDDLRREEQRSGRVQMQMRPRSIANDLRTAAALAVNHRGRGVSEQEPPLTPSPIEDKVTGKYESRDSKKRRRCVSTNVFGRLRIDESSPGRDYYHGFEKDISDGTIEKYVLGDQVYLLPASVHDEMYIAQIESIFVECGGVYVNCRWFERLGNNELRLTDVTDINPIECIEGKCDILRRTNGKDLYCKCNFSNGWFY